MAASRRKAADPAPTLSEGTKAALALLSMELFGADHLERCRARLADLSDDEFALVMRRAKDVGCDPLNGEIYYKRREGTATEAGGLNLMMKYGAMMAYAHRQGDFRPDDATMTVIRDVNFVAKPNEPVSIIVMDENLRNPDTNPEGIIYCATAVYRHMHGAWHRITHTVLWNDYVPLGPSKKIPTHSIWRQIPGIMLMKVAQVGALRKAYPVLGALYIEEEMARAPTSDAVEPFGAFSDAPAKAMPSRLEEAATLPIPAAARVLKDDVRIPVDFLDGRGYEEVWASEYARVVGEYLKGIEKDPKRVVEFFDANLDARQTFHTIDQKLTGGQAAYALKVYHDNARRTLGQTVPLRRPVLPNRQDRYAQTH